MFTVQQVADKLSTSNLSTLPAPTKNKGYRGTVLQELLEIPNSKSLKDCIDGDIKSFTLGQPVAITMLKHCLTQIIEESVEFEASKVYEKLENTLFVGFDKSNQFINAKVINKASYPELYDKFAEDYNFISAQVKYHYFNQKTLHTINGPDKFIQIRTKGSKYRNGNYSRLCYNGFELKDKAMAFYFLGSFASFIIK
ncbi:MAG: hypothetical protein ACL9RN_12240 [Cylindrospermopsis raciborskii]|uniref:hypothetical protein n=1 Tax=Cylindrospermopsis raciborskii TaxID=77022 RepID=UPI003D10BDC6